MIYINGFIIKTINLIIAVLLLIFSQIKININRFEKIIKRKICKCLKSTLSEIEAFINKEEIEFAKKNEKNRNRIKELIRKIEIQGIIDINGRQKSNLNLKVIVLLESINRAMKNINEEDSCNYYKILINLKKQIINIMEYEEGKIEIESLYIELINFSNSICYEDYSFCEVSENFRVVAEYLYIEEKSSLSMNSSLIKKMIGPEEYQSVRFSLIFRMMVVIIVCVFIIKLFNITYGNWIIITVLVTMKPYMETSKVKARNKVVSTLEGVLIFTLAFSIVEIVYLRIVLLLIVAFVCSRIFDYNKRLVFGTIASLTIASINMDFNNIALNKLMYIAVAIIISLIANRFIFPHSIKDDTKELIIESIAYNKKIIDEIIKKEEDNKKENIIKLILKKKEIDFKISINNKYINCSEIEEFLNNENVLLNNIILIATDINNEVLTEEGIKDNNYIKIKDRIIYELNNENSQENILLLINIYKVYVFLNKSENILRKIELIY